MVDAMGMSDLNETEQCPEIFYLHPWEIDPGSTVGFRHHDCTT